MTSTGTKDITTPASAIKVDKRRPKPELIKAHNYKERTDQKNTPGVLFKLLGNHDITMNKNTVII